MANLAKLVKEYVEKQIGYREFASRFVEFDSDNELGEASFYCLAHPHTHSTRSASLNVQTGLWKCFSSVCDEDKNHGDVIDLYRLAKGIKTNATAIKHLATELGLIKELSDGEIKKHHQYLFSNTQIVDRVGKILGVSAETLKHFQIGWMRQEPECSRITIPIAGDQGWEDIRCYSPSGKPKIRHWAPAHGGVRWFPLGSLQLDEVIFFAGEKDTLRAWDIGLKNAFTVTGAEGTLPSDWSVRLQGKVVYVCFDIDKAGREGAQKVARKLARVAAGVYLVSLPLEGLPDNGDFSDWANLGHGLQDFLALLQEAAKVEPDLVAPVDSAFEEQEPVTVSFRDLQSESYYNVPIRFIGHALGVSQGVNIYQAPATIEANCPMNQGKLCSHCGLKDLPESGRPWTFQINHRREEALRLIRTSDVGQNMALRQMYRINRKCDAVTLVPKTRQHIQHLFVSPAVELTEMRENYSGYVVAYYHGDPISENRDYWFTGYLQADSKEQRAVLNLFRAEPARNAIDHFVVNDEVLEAVEWFRPGPGVTVTENMRRLHEVIEADIGIWGQHPLQQAYLDAIFSVLQFNCGNHFVQNGWNEILIIGDSGTGKSTAGRRILKMINVGEFISGENVTAAGLIGGVDWIDKVAIAKWGAIPRNHRGVIVIDEIDEMQRKDRDIIGQLTALRSSGEAEMQKIVHDRVMAQVRMVWITNPEEGRTIQSYNGACRAISGVIKSRQDIARFTKIYAVADDNISIDTITQNRPIVQKPGVRKHFNNLAILTWSLKPEQVGFSPDSVEYLRRETARLSEKYHQTLPLLEKGRAMEKLAKLSVPVAVLCGSFKEQNDGLQLRVEIAHVQYAIWHLEEVYDSSAMNFQNFSSLERDREYIPDPKGVLEAMKACGDVKLDALARFLMNPTVTRAQLEGFAFNRTAADFLWSKLLANNCLVYNRNSEVAAKTAAFVELLNGILDDTSGRLSTASEAVPGREH